MFETNRKQILVAVILVCAITFGTGYKVAQIKEEAVANPVIAIDAKESAEKAKNRMVTVHITGAVNKPGVYILPEGSRIVEGLDKAELQKDADPLYINLAEIMADEQQIIVPFKSKNAGNGSIDSRNSSGAVLTNAQLGKVNGKININTADLDVLDELSGIGPAMAQRIIDYRKEHGKFKKTSDLLQVTGIGQKKFDKIKDLITI